jgi:histidinol-phosphate aminotransferase
MAALRLGDGFVAERRTRRNRIRAGVCAWLDKKGVRYIPPHANFILMDIGRNVQEAITGMLAQGVAVGRRFDSLDTWMRVAMGTEEEMAKFRAAFEKVVLS